MKAIIKMFIIIIYLVNTNLSAQNEDCEGCKDHPIFNRMPNFHIITYVNKDFEAFKFPVENSTAENVKKETIEGNYFEIAYALNEGAKEISALQVFRNFENALKLVNATVVAKFVEGMNSSSFITAKATQNNKETQVYINSTDLDYQLLIVEKVVMEQVIKANAMMDALNKDGFIALNILFDTNKSTIKKESQAIVDELYSLLNDNPTLEVKIEGHTDNTGTSAKNKILSEERAKAVAAALTAKGIGKIRLSSAGWGQEKPVGDNNTEEGCAKNRRAEIVKR